jgi:hypothetical protein
MFREGERKSKKSEAYVKKRREKGEGERKRGEKKRER